MINGKILYLGKAKQKRFKTFCYCSHCHHLEILVTEWKASVFVTPWDLSLVPTVEQKDIKRDVHVSLIFIHFDFYREEWLCV